MALDPPGAHLPLLAEPQGPAVASAAFEFLLIELVPLAHRIAAELSAKEQEWLGRRTHQTQAKQHERRRSRQGGMGGKDAGQEQEDADLENPTANLGVGGIGGSAPGLDEEEMREAVFWRLERLGYRVGLGLAERFSKDKPRFADTLDVIKFLCKDLWTLVFRKQIDNLKTNHRGVYVLTDNAFRPLSKMSIERGRGEAVMMAQAQPFLYFPAGLIRGVLASMGIVATVTGETSALPIATFQIRTQGSKP